MSEQADCPRDRNGDDSYEKLWSIAGAYGLLLGATGGLVEEAGTRRQGVEITVRMDNGGIISVVQEVSGSASFHAGDRVRVLTLGGTTRIAQ